MRFNNGLATFAAYVMLLQIASAAPIMGLGDAASSLATRGVDISSLERHGVILPRAKTTTTSTLDRTVSSAANLDLDEPLPKISVPAGLTSNEQSEYESIMWKKKNEASFVVPPRLAELQAKKDAMLTLSGTKLLTMKEAEEYQKLVNLKQTLPTMFNSKPLEVARLKELETQMRTQNAEYFTKTANFQARFGTWDPKKMQFDMDPEGPNSAAAKYMKAAQEQEKALNKMFEVRKNGPDVPSKVKFFGNKKMSAKELHNIRLEDWRPIHEEVAQGWADQQAAERQRLADIAAKEKAVTNAFLSQIEHDQKPVSPKGIDHIVDAALNKKQTAGFSHDQTLFYAKWANGEPRAEITAQLKTLTGIPNPTPEQTKQINELMARAAKLNKLGSGIGEDIKAIYKTSNNHNFKKAAMDDFGRHFTWDEKLQFQKDAWNKNLEGSNSGMKTSVQNPTVPNKVSVEKVPLQKAPSMKAVDLEGSNSDMKASVQKPTMPKISVEKAPVQEVPVPKVPELKEIPAAMKTSAEKPTLQKVAVQKATVEKSIGHWKNPVPRPPVEIEPLHAPLKPIEHLPVVPVNVQQLQAEKLATSVVKAPIKPQLPKLDNKSWSESLAKTFWKQNMEQTMRKSANLEESMMMKSMRGH